MEFFDSWHLQVPALRLMFDGIRVMRTSLPADFTAADGFMDGVGGQLPNPEYSLTAEAAAAPIDQWNSDFAALATDLRKTPVRLSYQMRSALMIAARLVCAFGFWFVPLAWWQCLAVLVGIQLVLAPLSFVPSLGWAIGDFSFRSGHHVLYFLLGAVWDAVLPEAWASAFNVEINATTCALFVAADVAQCFYASVYGSGNKENMPIVKPAAFLKSIAWGAVTCRVVPIVQFAMLRGHTFNAALIAIDYAVGGLERTSRALEPLLGLSPLACQYPVHRVGHLPVMYEHAHKGHHRTTQYCTAFESSLLGGVALAEEIVPIVLDTACGALLGTGSHQLNYFSFKSNYFAKMSHTVFPHNTEAEQLHMAHHTHPGVAFAAPWHDIFFGTGATRGNGFSSVGGGSETVDCGFGKVCVRDDIPSTGGKPRRIRVSVKNIDGDSAAK